MIRPIWPAGALSILLILAGCGSGADDRPDTGNTAATTAVEPTTTAAASPAADPASDSVQFLLLDMAEVRMGEFMADDLRELCICRRQLDNGRMDDDFLAVGECVRHVRGDVVD